MYCLKLLESTLEDIMHDGYGKPFKQFDNDKKQEIINDVIKAFDDDNLFNDNLFILRDKYVINGKSGVLSAEDFKITEELVLEEEPVQGLIDALEEIVHPVRFMRERLEEGEQLNGMLAAQLAKDAEYLRDIAIKALTTYREKMELT